MPLKSLVIIYFLQLQLSIKPSFLQDFKDSECVAVSLLDDKQNQRHTHGFGHFVDRQSQKSTQTLYSPKIFLSVLDLGRNEGNSRDQCFFSLEENKAYRF